MLRRSPSGSPTTSLPSTRAGTRRCSPRNSLRSGTSRFDLDLTGFDAGAIERILSGEEMDENAGLTDEDDVPEPEEKPVTRPGDLWVTGTAPAALRRRHRDCRSRAAARRRLADMAFTDPPVQRRLRGQGGRRRTGKSRPSPTTISGDGFERVPRRGLLGILLRSPRARSTSACLRPSCTRCRSAFRRRRRPLVDLHHLGEERVHARPLRLPAAVRADPLWLDGGRRPLLVRRARPGRCLVLRQAARSTTCIRR